MPTKRSRKRTAAHPAFVLFAVVYDPDNRQGNIRLVIEGPFHDSATAVASMKTLVKGRSFSVADTQIVPVRSAEFFRETIDRIRAILKKQ